MISEEYLAHLRTKPCALCPATLAEPHHIRNRAWREVKRNDATCAPLCRECHELVHSTGLAATLNRRGITIWRFVETITGHLVEFFSRRKLRFWLCLACGYEHHDDELDLEHPPCGCGEKSEWVASSREAREVGI